MDLWVVEPDGQKCYFDNQKTPGGGELLQDMKSYGPEEYQAVRAQEGRYRIKVHQYGPATTGQGPTRVDVQVRLYAGTDRETVRRYTVTLNKEGDVAEVCSADF